jgi:hypothetical protein
MTILAESSKEDYGLKRAILSSPTTTMMMMIAIFWNWPVGINNLFFFYPSLQLTV